MKQVTDYEVEGCWSSPNTKTKCRCCGTKLEPVPIKGHYNTKYWILKRNDGLLLFCCPKGCNVEKANKIMREYFKYFAEWCTEDSQSYKYKLDFTKFRNCWIDPKGKCYPVHYEGHNDFANSLDLDQRDLEEKGWVKITTVDWLAIRCDYKPFSQKQLDTIFDFCIAHDQSIEGLDRAKERSMFHFKPNKPVYK